MTDQEWTTVEVYSAMVEAEVAAGRLDSAGIPSRIDSRDTIGLFGPGHAGHSVRGVSLQVPTTRLEEARVALDLDSGA